MFDQFTRPLGLFGYPLEHSLSPAMHNAALQKIQANYFYLALPVTPPKLHEALQGFRAMGFAGANVTIPHKESVAAFVDELTEQARLVGAVNTLYWSDKHRLVGDNTDVMGFHRTLVEYGIDMYGRTALIIGTGGAARAVAVALAEIQVKEIIFLARRAETAEKLLRDLRPFFPKMLWSYHLKTTAAFVDDLTRTSLVVNASPVGMAPQTQTSPLAPQAISRLPGGAYVYDLVYNPSETALLKQAKTLGYKTYSGLDMLVYQGAEAFQLWTGQVAPVETTRQVLQAQIQPKPQASPLLELSSEPKEEKKKSFFDLV